MGNFCCIVCELDDFVDDDDRAFQRQHNQRKKQLKEQQDVLSYGLILTLPGSSDGERMLVIGHRILINGLKIKSNQK